MKKTNQSNIEKKPIVVAFANQKGGVGKTTISHLTAKTIGYEAIGEKPLVIELDYQKSLSDIKKIIQEKDPKNFTMPYDLMVLKNYDNLTSIIEKESEKYSIIFLDTPGTLDKTGLIAALTMADILFIPLSSSILEVNASVDFIQTMFKIKEYRVKNNLPFEYYTILSRAKENTKYFQYLLDELGEMKINRFSSIIKDLEIYKNFHMENYQPVFSYGQKGSRKDESFEKFTDEFLAAVNSMREKI